MPAGQDEIESLAASIRAYLPDLEKIMPDKAQVRAVDQPRTPRC